MKTKAAPKKSKKVEKAAPTGPIAEIKKGSIWREKGKTKPRYFRALAIGPKNVMCETRSSWVGRFSKEKTGVPREDFGTKLRAV